MTNEFRNAEEDAYIKIKRAIMLKRLLPGQQLTEEWIGKNLNMSRTPVRGAFKKLEKEGLVKILPRRGAFVHDPTDKEVRDVFAVRILLESFAARTAAAVITQKYIDELLLLSEQEIDAYQARNFENFININNRIHRLPALATENKCLIEQVTSLVNWSDCYLILKDSFYTNPIEKVKSIPEHLRIIDALKNKDPIEAENAVRAHLETTLRDWQTPKPLFAD
ncbi:GntR family transcriptional regulator [Bacillus sp. UNC41MFS5]|uniref:GntR family transcriptional regulator n=1 Tax=Bacillus sp. UNC41MFS5 TaxID=1449046 RepID=UPI000479BCC4|nr:GntR family transcriptional regulator [Bacillus sp. UNC41MFS5]